MKLRKRREKEKKKLYILLVLLFVLSIGIGYAVLSETLQIIGTIEYNTIKWDVGFTTVEDGGGTVQSSPIISDDKKSVTITCNIGTSTSSETCIAKTKIKNGSTFDIELSQNPTITYDDTYINSVVAVWMKNNVSIVAGDTLSSNTEEELEIKITTKELTKEMLPQSTLSIPVTFTMNWIEKNDDSNENLPSYWKTYLDSKISEINEKTNSLGSDSDSFIFITDQHLDENPDYSSAIINYVTKKTSVKKVVFGGDTLQGSQNDKTILSGYRTSFNNNLLVMPIRGNHDADGNVDENAYYDIMLKPLEGKIVKSDKLYYHYDNDSLKIRYIFTDSTSHGDTNIISDEQILWMKERILELESDWTVLIFHHGIWTGSETNTELIMSNEGKKIVDAIDSVYSNASCTIAGIYTGHTHRDYYKKSDKGYFIVSTTLDASTSDLTKYDPVNSIRDAGTTEEQTFDVVFVNPKNKSVETIRIGVGNNRNFNYEKVNYEIKQTDITSDFTWNGGIINITKDGEYSDEYSDIWVYSNAVDISSYKTLTFTHIQTTSSGTTAGYAFYDEQGNFISGGSNYGTSYAPVEKTIIIPSNAKYFRTMWINTGNSNYNSEIHDINTKFKCYGNEFIVSNIEDITSQFEWTAGSIEYSTGVASDEYSESWLYSNFVNVQSYQSITFTHAQTTNASTPLGYAFYDENYEYISGATNGGTSYNPIEKTINVPSNAKYFRTMWINTTNQSYNSTLHDINTKFKCYGIL